MPPVCLPAPCRLPACGWVHGAWAVRPPASLGPPAQGGCGYQSPTARTRLTPGAVIEVALPAVGPFHRFRAVRPHCTARLPRESLETWGSPNCPLPSHSCRGLPPPAPVPSCTQWGEGHPGAGGGGTIVEGPPRSDGGSPPWAPGNLYQVFHLRGSPNSRPFGTFTPAPPPAPHPNLSGARGCITSLLLPLFGASQKWYPFCSSGPKPPFLGSPRDPRALRSYRGAGPTPGRGPPKPRGAQLPPGAPRQTTPRTPPLASRGARVQPPSPPLLPGRSSNGFFFNLVPFLVSPSTPLPPGRGTSRVGGPNHPRETRNPPRGAPPPYAWKFPQQFPPARGRPAPKTPHTWASADPCLLSRRPLSSLHGSPGPLGGSVVSGPRPRRPPRHRFPSGAARRPPVRPVCTRPPARLPACLRAGCTGAVRPPWPMTPPPFFSPRGWFPIGPCLV